MADETTDLTDGEEPVGKGTRPKKSVKPVKGKTEAENKEAPAEPEKGGKPGKKGKGEKGKGDKAKGEKKKGSKIWVILIIILIILILIAAFCAAVYFNLFGFGDIILEPVGEWLFGLMVWIDPEFSSVEKVLKEEAAVRSAALDVREQALNTREEEIIAREEAANTREKQIDRRAQTLDRREEVLDIREDSDKPRFRKELTDRELEDITSLSRTYAQMAPETAAEILAELYEPMDIASILYFMAERNAASVLSAMEIGLAAIITEILLKS